MNRRSLGVATVTALILIATPASAAPPANALPLSEVLARFETQPEFSHFDEVEWDSSGYWKVEFYDASGRKSELRIDPVSGERISR